MSVLASSSTASQVYPGLVGFLVVAGMGLALYFLFRSMNKQFHKITPVPPGADGDHAEELKASSEPPK